jgi:hypothetical protein
MIEHATKCAWRVWIFNLSWLVFFTPTFRTGSFDALLCLGNSLPHLTGPNDLEAALGLCICLPRRLAAGANRNFDAVMASLNVGWNRSRTEENKEWLFLRF